jgi:hypothetical protein
MRRQVFSASSISLNARPTKVGRDTQLRVRVVRCRTVANVDSIALVVRRCNGSEKIKLLREGIASRDGEPVQDDRPVQQKLAA